MWAPCLGALTHTHTIKMTLMQQLRKNPPIRGIVLHCMTCFTNSVQWPLLSQIIFASSFTNCYFEVCFGPHWLSWQWELMNWLSLSFSSPLPSLTFSVPLAVSLPFTFPPWRTAGRSWDQGEQMLHEGGGGDAGVYADHHVLDVLIHALPLHFCLHTASWSNMAAYRTRQRDRNQIRLLFFFSSLSLQVWFCNWLNLKWTKIFVCLNCTDFPTHLETTNSE